MSHHDVCGLYAHSPYVAHVVGHLFDYCKITMYVTSLGILVKIIMCNESIWEQCKFLMIRIVKNGVEGRNAIQCETRQN